MTLPPLGSREPWTGGAVTERATCILAGNPGPMTLDGTNTWILAEPGSRHCLVVDPGPDDAAHLHAIETAVDGRRVAAILLTHGHPDHAEGAAALAARVGAGVRALDPAYQLGTEGLTEGEHLNVDGLVVHIVATPGHTADSLCLLLPADGALLTGDTVLGRGTSVIAWPDGDLADYLGSLDRLRGLARNGALDVLLPGHGPALRGAAEARALLEGYADHRRQRLELVRRARRDGAGTAQEVVDAVYADVPGDVRAAALMSVQAQLDYLDARGE